MHLSKTFIVATLAVLGAASPMILKSEDQQPVSLPAVAEGGIDVTVTVHVPGELSAG